jgi:hypothetical protein
MAYEKHHAHEISKREKEKEKILTDKTEEK